MGQTLTVALYEGFSREKAKETLTMRRRMHRLKALKRDTQHGRWRWEEAMGRTGVFLPAEPWKC